MSEQTPEEKAAAEQAAADQAAADQAAAASNGKKVKARVLTACDHGQANDVVLLDAAAAKAGKVAGELDLDKAAVAYAESLVGS